MTESWESLFFFALGYINLGVVIRVMGKGAQFQLTSYKCSDFQNPGFFDGLRLGLSVQYSLT